LTHHTAVAVRIALWSLKGTINGSPSNILAMILPPKHSNILDIHNDKGCLRENIGLPVKLLMIITLIFDHFGNNFKYMYVVHINIKTRIKEIYPCIKYF